MSYRYTAVFETTAQIISPSEEDRSIAKASLAPLAKLLPPGVDPEENPDMLYISCNGAVAGLCNRNADAISNETALAIHKSAQFKPLNFNHDRDQVVGVVLYPALSRFGSNEPLSETEAAALGEPFNMSFVGAIWKVVSPMVAKHVAQQGDSIGENVLSVSWEIGFDSWEVGIGSPDVSQARVVKASDPSFAVYDKYLLQNGGKGKDPSGQNVYRIISGDAIMLGYGLVLNPAAKVKGILPIEKAAPAAPVAVELSATQIDAIAESLKKKIQDSEASKKIAVETVLPLKTEVAAPVQTASSVPPVAELFRTPTNTRVTPNTQMKIETVEQLTANWEEIRKLETAASVADFVKAIKDGSDKYMADLKAQEDLLKNAELAKAANEKRATELQASLEQVQKELAEVRASQEAIQANQKFQERMAAFDEKFDLDDEDRALLTQDIKDLDDDAFAAYAKKCDKLMAAKSKKAKPFEKKDDKKEEKEEKEEKETEEECAAKKAAAEAAELAAKDAAIKAAVASIKEIGGQVTLPNGVAVDQDALQQMNAAFGASLKIDGKTVEERKAARAKAKK